MEYIYGKTDFVFRRTCVTLGKFDGLHRGHQRLLNELAKYEDQGLTSVMFTFDYHPGNLFSEKEINLILTEEEKKYILQKNGPKVLISYPFTLETAAMEPEEFIEKILFQKLDAKVIVVGSDYRFGNHRRGDVNMLKQYEEKYNYQLIVCEKLMLDDSVISSTRIREQIKKGNMEYVNEMLGFPYTIIGEVVHGKKLGRTLGIPTINQIPSKQKLLPPDGVYASVVKFDDLRFYGITNIGTKPTVSGDKIRGVETFLFDYEGDLYGKTVQVDLHVYERKEEKFASLEELIQRMQMDIEFAKDYFKLKILP